MFIFMNIYLYVLIIFFFLYNNLLRLGGFRFKYDNYKIIGFWVFGLMVFYLFLVLSNIILVMWCFFLRLWGYVFSIYVNGKFI